VQFLTIWGTICQQNLEKLLFLHHNLPIYDYKYWYSLEVFITIIKHCKFFYKKHLKKSYPKTRPEKPENPKIFNPKTRDFVKPDPKFVKTRTRKPDPEILNNFYIKCLRRNTNVRHSETRLDTGTGQKL
jgi:hypothetical protein